MDLPDPPTPDQLPGAGIQIDAPPPPDNIQGMSDAQLEELSKPQTDFGHLSDEELQKIVTGTQPNFDHLSDEELEKIVGKKKSPSASPSEVVSAFLAPANKFIMAPVRAGAWGMNKVLTGLGVQSADNPDIENTLKHNFWPDVKDTRATRIATSAGEMIPDTAALMATAGAAAPEIMGAKASETAAPRLMGALQDTFGHYAARPGALMADVGYNAPLAGAGIGTAREYTRGTPYQGLAEAAAGMVTPAMASGIPWYVGNVSLFEAKQAAKFLGTHGLDALAQNLPEKFTSGNGKIANILSNFKANRIQNINDKALPMAAGNFQSLATPSALEGMDTAERLRGQMPGFNPTLAETTGLKSIMNTQAGIDSRASGNVLDQLVARKQGSENAIKTFAEQNAPPPASGDIENAVERRVQQAVKPVEDQLASVKTLRESQADALPQTKPYDSGSYLRDRLETLRTDKQGEMAKLADDLGLNDAKNLRVSRDAMQKAVSASRDSPQFSALSPTMRKIARLDPGTPLSFKDAKAAMENLGAEARLAAKQGNMVEARTITQARNNIDDYLTNEWAPALKIGDKYSAYRERYLNEYIKPFEQGTAKDIKSIGGDQTFRTDNEDVASKFWRPGGETEARDFNKTFAGDPKATEALQAHVLDDVRQSTVEDGQINPAKLDKWLKANPQIDQFPELKKQVTDMKSLATNLAQRQTTLEARKEMVENTNLSKVLNDKGVTLDGLLEDKPAFKRVIQGATPEEKAVMARQLYQRAGQNAKEDPAAMKQFMDEHGDVMGQLLTKDHVNALSDIQKAWEMHARMPEAQGTGMTDNAFEKFKGVTGSSPQQLLSRFFAVKSGRTGLKYTMGDLLARFGIGLHQRQAAQLMEKAIYDPEVAKQLADYVRPDQVPTPKKLKYLKASLFQSGITGMADQMDDHQAPHIEINKGASWDSDPAHQPSPMQNKAKGGIIRRFASEVQ